MDNQFAKICLPLGLKLAEWDGMPDTLKEHLEFNGKRWGLLEDIVDCWHAGISTIVSTACKCFRWGWTTTATVHGQTDFTPPPQYQMEDNAFHIVFARYSFQYLNFDYNILPGNTLRLFAGIPLGEPLTIYAMRNDDIQDIHYEHCAVPALPYAFSPPVTVDRAPGRQLVFAHSSFRFLDSARPGDEYTVSNTLNTVSLSAGLGPVGARAALFRLKESCVDWHEEILADTAGQTVFEPIHLGNRFVPHQEHRMIVASRTSFRHPGIDYVTNPLGNTLTLLRHPMGFGDPLNVWIYR